MARGPDAGTLVERVLGQSAATAGVTMTLVDAIATRWSSATFAGARHVLELHLDDDERARDWLGALAEADLSMRGHLMADCAVVRIHAHDGTIEARVEALTVEIGPG